MNRHILLALLSGTPFCSVSLADRRDLAEIKALAADMREKAAQKG